MYNDKQVSISLYREINLLFENLYNLDELLIALNGNYKRSTIYYWVNRQNMPHSKIRGKLMFDPAEVRRWLERS